MDHLPQIPTTSDAVPFNDTTLDIRNKFKENFENEAATEDVATNIDKYLVDDNLSLKEVASNVLSIFRCLEEESTAIRATEEDIIQQHQDYIFYKNSIEKNEFLKEIMKLKPCDIFNNICLPDKLRYGLIEKSDLYPDLLRQYLDFKFNTTLHRCKNCFIQQEKEYPSQPEPLIRKICRTKKNIVKEIKHTCSSTFKINPCFIIFKNFEPNQIYEQIIKIQNKGTQIQKLSIKIYPKLPVFKLIFNACQNIAPGMCATGKLIFSPSYYKIFTDEIFFISRKGEEINIPIKCYREPPKLSGYILKSPLYSQLVESFTYPNSKGFSLRRQHAVNNTIDCGSCFATEHILISLILYNHGHKAKFFWLNEDDFLHQDVTKISKNYELAMEGFWLFPSYFEIIQGDLYEINILFQPLYTGFYTQTLFLMCDNNCFRQIEIIGDAISFNRNMITIDVPDKTKEIEKLKGHCIYIGYVNSQEDSSFILSITNKSSLYLKYELDLITKNPIKDMSKWTKISNKIPEYLAPYSTTDVIFKTACSTDIISGYYNANLRLFIKNIPIASLEENEEFLVDTAEKTLDEIINNVSLVDILIIQVEVACFVHYERKKEIIAKICEECGNINCNCEDCHRTVPLANLKFDMQILDFGILPVGANVKKEFNIINVGKKELEWHITELKYNIDSAPFIQIVKKSNLSSVEGNLHPNKKHTITYRIIDKPAAKRWVSILILFSSSSSSKKKKTAQELNESNLIAESICIVTYEIAKLELRIKTGQSQEAILCPMQMLYVGVPINISFKIQNFSIISGCFYFMEPIGSDSKKVKLEYCPQSGEIPAGKTIKISLKLTCYEVGILENIFIPCFVGKDQEPLQLRVLCVVDCIHVFFYLPSINGEFEKILWPPKVVYEYDLDWSTYCLCEDSVNAYEDLKSIQVEHEEELNKKSIITLNDIKESLSDFNNNNDNQEESLVKKLIAKDSEIFLQNYVMEVMNIKTKELKKVTIFIENVTPKVAKFSIQATNFPPRDSNFVASTGSKFFSIEELWENQLDTNNNNGIVVHPETDQSYIRSHELIKINIWIYAKTWGIYVEELIVDIENITSFSFSLILEIVGTPLEMPMAKRCITKYPTIRLGSFCIGTEPITTNIRVKNTSSIDVTVSWHLFHLNEDEQQRSDSKFNFICDIVENPEEKFNFDITEGFFGIEASTYIEINPTRLKILSEKNIELPIKFSPPAFSVSEEQKVCIKTYLLGRIYPNDMERLKSNYFYRPHTQIIAEILTSIEKPSILVEMDNDTLNVFANDIAVTRQINFFLRCILRNPTSASIEMNLDCLEPLSLSLSDLKIRLDPGKCKELYVPCILPYEKIVKWAAFVYRQTEIIHPTQLSESSGKVQLSSILEDREIDDENKILTFHRKLELYFKGGFKSLIPIDIRIYYPNITVKPMHIKFGYVLLGKTQKAIITIYNLSGCSVLFEIYKTLSSQEIYVSPPNGEIEKTVGLNYSFKYLNVYFTPTECKTYHESIRIATNIPHYYVDISIKGAGSYNEKFE